MNSPTEKIHLHLVGVCGTFMGGVARIARQLGYQVSGSDGAFYEPMASQLKQADIECCQGYDCGWQDRPADLYIIGNVARRGMPLVESILASGKKFTSAPAWVASQLAKRRTIAVAGTHGKTTTTSMLIHILTETGCKPSYLLGGVHSTTQMSANLAEGEYFVIEADEYDSAFFDKRPKFVHYWCEVAVLNNIEFDHADIYRDLDEVLRQFALLGRCVLPNGTMVVNGASDSCKVVVTASDWCKQQLFDCEAGWQLSFAGELTQAGKSIATGLQLPLGQHNRSNATAAIAAAAAIGIEPVTAARSLASFELPMRRLQPVVVSEKIVLIDDFAHHPTAIAASLAAVREMYPKRRLVALLEVHSNTMRAGHWRNQLQASLVGADKVYALGENLSWDLSASLGEEALVGGDATELIELLSGQIQPGDVIVSLSNGDLGGTRQKLKDNIRLFSI